MENTNSYKGNTYLRSRTFYWVAGVFLVILMAVLGYIIGRVDETTQAFNHNITEIKVEISAIKTDLRLLRLDH